MAQTEIVKASDEFFGTTRFFGMFVLFGGGGGEERGGRYDFLAFVFVVLTIPESCSDKLLQSSRE